MNKKSLVAALLCCVFALTLGLVGCGGSGGGTSSAASDPIAESKAAFTGTWMVTSMEQNDKTVSEEDLTSLRNLGLGVDLILTEDGKATLDMMGEKMTGEWTPKTATEADVTIEGETIGMTLDSDVLTMEQSGTKLVFKKGEASDASSASAALATGNPQMRGSDYFNEEVAIDPYVVADDDIVTITAVEEALDFEDDPAVILEISNNGDKTIYVTSAKGSFSVNGTLSDPTLATTVEPGTTAESIMFFDHNEINVNALTDFIAIEGSIEVWDDDTLETLATYDFKL